jgi:hypothetical protein
LYFLASYRKSIDYERGVSMDEIKVCSDYETEDKRKMIVEEE